MLCLFFSTFLVGNSVMVGMVSCVFLCSHNIWHEFTQYYTYCLSGFFFLTIFPIFLCCRILCCGWKNILISPSRCLYFETMKCTGCVCPHENGNERMRTKDTSQNSLRSRRSDTIQCRVQYATNCMLFLFPWMQQQHMLLVFVNAEESKIFFSFWFCICAVHLIKGWVFHLALWLLQI